MVKKEKKTIYVCSNCGATSTKFRGMCEACGEWNTFVETVAQPEGGPKGKNVSQKQRAVPVTEIESINYPRFETFSDELNRVLGGGLVQGSVTLLGGAPGIGKSSLSTQIAAHAAKSAKVLYVSAEESPSQIKLRLNRFNANSDQLYVMSEQSIESIFSECYRLKPELLIIDSIQTVYTAQLESSPGLISQVRESGSMIADFAKSNNVTTIIIGHVTKDNAIAGPRQLEHVVDTTLYFEGDNLGMFRILRSIKNRFGATPELGVFEMKNDGLQDVKNPSEIFLSERNNKASGTTIGIAMEGSRPILLEIQALVDDNDVGSPARNANGFDRHRLSMLAGVISKHTTSIPLSNRSVTANIVGGINVKDDRSIDLPMALSMITSFDNFIVPPDYAAVGEIDLTGAIRAVSRMEMRLTEAKKVGINHVIVPALRRHQVAVPAGLHVHAVESVDALYDFVRSQFK